MELSGQGRFLDSRDRPSLSDQDAAARRRQFPTAVVKGTDYGEVDPVMIDADIYAWALRVSQGEQLEAVDVSRLQDAHDALIRSIDAIPVEARPYFEFVRAIAHAALRRGRTHGA